MGDFFDRVKDHMVSDEAAAAVARRLPSLLSALAIVVVVWLIWLVVARTLEFFFRRTRFDTTAARFVMQISRALLMTMAILSALNELGVNTASILASLGVVGLTIGFAAKDALSNLISGIFIFWDRPFVVGDLVELNDVYGRVDDITLRSTRLVTPDGRMISLPNSIVVNAKIASYTSFPHLRLQIAFTVGVGEDIDRVRALLLPLGKGPQFMDEPVPNVVVTGLNDYNVALEFHVWLKDEKTHLVERWMLRERAFTTLRAANIDMPYETIALAPLDVRALPRPEVPS